MKLSKYKIKKGVSKVSDQSQQDDLLEQINLAYEKLDKLFFKLDDGLIKTSPSTLLIYLEILNIFINDIHRLVDGKEVS
jgi:hypothetical protein